MAKNRSPLSNWLACAYLSAVFLLNPAFAEKEAAPIAENPELEAKVKEIAQELRCLVCQNESIAGSHADLAIDLRNQIREKLSQNQSKAQIIDYMVTRYGDFVLYNPPLKSSTWVLWLSPFLLVLIGFFFLRKQILSLRSQSITPLTPQEIKQAQALLKEPSNTQSPKE
jgi:cytochrome c-type biogenesis protein CcmH